MPGHIMLYVGAYRGRALALHNLWGIKTEDRGREGRHIIGRCVISTLDVGRSLPDHMPGRLLMDRIDRMAFPTEP